MSTLKNEFQRDLEIVLEASKELDVKYTELEENEFRRNLLPIYLNANRSQEDLLIIYAVTGGPRWGLTITRNGVPAYTVPALIPTEGFEVELADGLTMENMNRLDAERANGNINSALEQRSIINSSKAVITNTVVKEQWLNVLRENNIIVTDESSKIVESLSTPLDFESDYGEEL